MELESLKREAGLVMAAAKIHLETHGNVEPIIMLHWPLDPFRHPRHTIVTPGDWLRMPCPPQVMNSGAAKTQYFSWLRDLVAYTHADATIFASEIWGGKLTPLGRKHQKEVNANVDKRFEHLVKLGWIVREQCAYVVAQTETDVVMMKHPYQRGSKHIQWIGITESSCGPQAGFGGRQKMFAIKPDSDLGEPPADSFADRANKGQE